MPPPAYLAIDHARHEQCARVTPTTRCVIQPASHQGAERAHRASQAFSYPIVAGAYILARRHGLDARVRHQFGALRHKRDNCAGAQSGARRRRESSPRARGREILRLL